MPHDKSWKRPPFRPYDIREIFDAEVHTDLTERFRRFDLLREKLQQGTSPVDLPLSSHPTIARLASLIAARYFGSAHPVDLFDLIQRLDLEGQRQLRDYLFPALAVREGGAA